MGLTNNRQFSIPRVFVLRTHDLVQVMTGGRARGDLVVFLKHGDISVSIAGELEGRRKAEDACADDSDRSGFGNWHGRGRYA